MFYNYAIHPSVSRLYVEPTEGLLLSRDDQWTNFIIQIQNVNRLRKTARELKAIANS